MLRALRQREIARLLRNCLARCRAGTCSKLFFVNALAVLLCKACRHPLMLGTMVEWGTQPGGDMILAYLDNSRCCSLIGCYGISGHAFIASDNFCARFS